MVVNVTYSCGGDIHVSTLFQQAEGPDVPTLEPHISVCDRRVLHVCLPDIGPAPSTCQVSNVSDIQSTHTHTHTHTHTLFIYSFNNVFNTPILTVMSTSKILHGLKRNVFETFSHT